MSTSITQTLSPQFIYYLRSPNFFFKKTELLLVESTFKHINVMCYFKEFYYNFFCDGNNHLQFVLLVFWVVMSQLCLCQGTEVDTYFSL